MVSDSFRNDPALDYSLLPTATLRLLRSLFCRNAYLLPKHIILLALPASITSNVVQMCEPVKGRVWRGRCETRRQAPSGLRQMLQLATGLARYASGSEDKS